MRLLLIVNPTASSMTPKRRVHIQKMLGEQHRLEVAETYRRGHATRLARIAAAEGVDVVIVAAGDGTLNEAANGLVGSSTALAPLPGGSTNVFARTIGVPNSVTSATELLIKSLNAKSIRRVGVGLANERYFLFHLGVGFDAKVIAQVERHHWIKRWFAHTVFAATTANTYFRNYDRKEPAFRVEKLDKTLIGEGVFSSVSNTHPYAFFGIRPLTVTKDAGFDRSLALTMFKNFDYLSTLTAMASAIGKGKHLQKKKSIIQIADLDGLRFISHHGPFPYQVDGDFLGEIERLEVSYVPDSLSLVVPSTTQ